MAASVTTGRALRYARGSARGLLHHSVGHCQANARWSLDFVYDQFACGRRFRVLNTVDDVTRECLAAVPGTSMPGAEAAHYIRSA